MKCGSGLSRRIRFICSLLTIALSCHTTALAAQFTLSWTNTALNASGVQISRKTGASGTYAVAATVGATVTSYLDATLAPGTTYCYQLRAFNANETSAPSPEVCATTAGQGSPLQTAKTSATGVSSNNVMDASSSLAVKASASDFVVQLGNTKIGVFRPSTGKWRLDLNGNGVWDGCQVDGCFGPFSEQATFPIIGDWTGTSTAQLGIFDAATGRWELDRNGNDLWDGCALDLCLNTFGEAKGFPVIGHWSTTPSKDSIGLFRPHQSLWALDLNGNGVWDGCQVDGCLGPFGGAQDLPVVGDWTGTGITHIGSFDPHTGLWQLDLNGNGVWDGCQVDGCLGPFGQAGDIPVAGSW
jgi:hypothetical protein